MSDGNYLLLFLSWGANLEGKERLHYRAPGCAWDVQGRQTNEAATKHVMKLLASEGQWLSRIIMLCTKEVLGGVLPFFMREISGFIEEEHLPGYDTEGLFEVIPFNQKGTQDTEEIVAPIRKIFEKTSSAKGRLFVDFTGGMRNSALMLIFATRILSQSGMDVAGIFYGDMSMSEGGGDGSPGNPYDVVDCMLAYSTLLELELKASEASEEGRKEILAALLDAKGATDSEKRSIERFYSASESAESSVSTNDSAIIREAVEEEAKAARALSPDVGERLGSVASSVVRKRQERGERNRRRLDEGAASGKVRANLDSGNTRNVLTTLNEEIVPILRERNLLDIYEGERIYRRRIAGKYSFDHALVRRELAAWYQYHQTYAREVRGILQKLQGDRNLKPMDQWDACSPLGKLREEVKQRRNIRPVEQNDFLVSRFADKNPGKALLAEMNAELYRKAKELGADDLAVFSEEVNAYTSKRAAAFSLFFSNRFPYVCVGKDGSRSLIFEGYDEGYRQQLLAALNRLNKLQKSGPDDYAREIDSLLDSDELFARTFPVEFSNRITTKLPDADKVEFFGRMLPLLDEIRRSRNDDAHGKNSGRKAKESSDRASRDLMDLIDEYSGKARN